MKPNVAQMLAGALEVLGISLPPGSAPGIRRNAFARFRPARSRLAGNKWPRHFELDRRDAKRRQKAARKRNRSH